MPIYEYECPKCGRFDVLQKMSAAPLEVHETCGSKVTKVISASAFSFKGSGFYVTDYGAKAAAPAKGRGRELRRAQDRGLRRLLARQAGRSVTP